jgi:hypothetical protein
MTTNMTSKDKAVIKQMEDQAKKSADLATKAKINPEDQVVGSGELLSIDKTSQKAGAKASKKTIDAPKDIDVPDKIKSEDVDKPKEFDVETYEAERAAPKLGTAEAAVSKVTDPESEDFGQAVISKESKVEAAQGEVSPEALATAATQELDPKATTRYQLAELFKGIEEGGPPPAWAAPAVRQVTAVMQQRGLGASSMAAAATMQAMMESGIPIAAQDAQKYATIQLQNLNNEQQAALQNAAAVLQMDMANLNNRQQAAVINAKSFLTMDIQNLTNEQQANTLTYQSKAQALLSDAAAQNAAKQFNAKSENEIQEFFTELGVQIEAANVGRRIAVDQFNSNQKVAIEQFNAQMDVAADQFNANMRLEIDQSNAVWRRNVNTRNTAAENEAQRQNALNLLGIQQNALNNLWQRYRDKAAWSVKISENAKDRAHNAAMQAAAIAENASSYDDKYDDFLFLTAIDKIWG